MHRDYFIAQVGGALDEQVSQTRRGSGIDDRDAVFLFEPFGVAELLGVKRVAGEMRAEIQVVGAQPQRRAHDDFVENGG